MRKILLSTFLVLGLSIGLAACSSSSSDAKSLAKEACQQFGRNSFTVGGELRDWGYTSEKAAQAAAIDARWTSLLASSQVEQRVWRLIADGIGMKVTDNYKKWSNAQRMDGYKYINQSDSDAEDKAIKNVQTQCAIANS